MRRAGILTISGAVFVGDILLREGEYQLAPGSAGPGGLTSDVGGPIFVRTSADFARAPSAPKVGAAARLGQQTLR